MVERESSRSMPVPDKQRWPLRRLIAPSLVLGAAIAGYLTYPQIREQERLNQIDPSFPNQSVDVMQFGYSPHGNQLSKVVGLEKESGLPIRFVNYFLPLISRDLAEIHYQAYQSCKRDITPMISWGETGDVFTVFEKSKPQVQKLARYLASLDCEVHFRPFFEMNGTWFSFGADNITPQQFIVGWRRVWDVFQEERANNVKFVFSPNSTVNAYPIEPYYPGDDVVDIVALDAYDKSNGNPFDIFTWLAFPPLSAKALLEPDLQTLRRIAPNDELMLAELGLVNNPEKLQQILAISREYGVTIVKWFGWNKRGVAFGEDNWGLEHHPELLIILASEFGVVLIPMDN